MSKLPLVVTAGGTATLTFGLADEDGDRIFNVIDDLVTGSIRRETTSRLSHEVPQHAATLDADLGVVTLDLTEAETALLAPYPTMSPQPRPMTCVGDVLIGGVDYYGPFSFTVRLPETVT